MIAILFSCSMLTGTPEPTPEAPRPKLVVAKPKAEVPKPEAKPEARTEIACAKPERTRLQCELSTGKKLALCEADGQFSFRYGGSTVELAFPETGYNKDFKLEREARGEDGEIHTVSFQREDYTYRMISERTEDQFDVMFEVIRGKQRLSKAECVKQEGIDFTELPELK